MPGPDRAAALARGAYAVTRDAAPSEFRVVIPARFASTRFPGKPLADLAGRPLIEHVYRRAVASGAVEVVVATDDARIARVAGEAGADVAMTDSGHASGTDRVAQVAAERGWTDDVVVVNLQGDAPLVPPGSLRQVARLLTAHPLADLATLCVPLSKPRDWRDPNVVKLVTDREGRALYFSRAPIPAQAHGRPADEPPVAWRHVGLYGYRVRALQRLTAAPPCYLERCEQLEQLRALWLNMEIRVGTAEETHGPDVDTPEDLGAALAFMDAETRRNGEA